LIERRRALQGNRPGFLPGHGLRWKHSRASDTQCDQGRAHHDPHDLL
jgi:hypothetical protein